MLSSSNSGPAQFVDHVQITVSEKLGVGGRGGYYEEAGAFRDMVQNHLLQVLALVAMEPPVSLAAESIRDEKVKLLRSIRPSCRRRWPPTLSAGNTPPERSMANRSPVIGRNRR